MTVNFPPSVAVRGTEGVGLAMLDGEDHSSPEGDAAALGVKLGLGDLLVLVTATVSPAVSTTRTTADPMVSATFAVNFRLRFGGGST